MQPFKISTLTTLFTVMLLLVWYSIAQAWWFGFASAAVVMSMVLQWQLTQLQQRTLVLAQRLQVAPQLLHVQQTDPLLALIPVGLALLASLAFFWQHRLGLLLSSMAWLAYFAWALYGLQQRVTQLEQHALNDESHELRASYLPPAASPINAANNANVSTTWGAQSKESSPHSAAAASWMQSEPAAVGRAAVNTSTQTAHDCVDSIRINSASVNATSANATSINPTGTHSAQFDSATVHYWQKAQHWLLQGNPILRVAVLLLLVGAVLLLRFASEHWQLSLAAKLSMIAAAGALATGLAYRLRQFNALVAVAVQGVGLAVVFLSLIFAYQDQVLSSLVVSALMVALLLAITTMLSLRQSSRYLALLALGMAYLAPILIPQSQPNVLLIFAYYLFINIAVAVLNHTQGWKILNHVAFAASMLLAGSLIIERHPEAQYLWLDALLWLHMALFIYVSVRYSQLMQQQQEHQQQDQLQHQQQQQPHQQQQRADQRNNAALLDVGLIFAVPIVGFSLHAVFMQNDVWGLTLGAAALAVTYTALMLWARRQQPQLVLLSKSFLILSMAFIALIFPLAQGAHWSSMGWVVQGSALVVWGSAQRSALSRYMGSLLILLSSVTLLAQLWSNHPIAHLTLAIYALALFVAAGALIKNTHSAHPQMTWNAALLSSIFLALALYAGSWVSVAWLQLQAGGLSAYVAAASILLAGFSVWMHFAAALKWQTSQWLIVLLLSVLHWQVWLDAPVQVTGVWQNNAVHAAFLATALIQTALLWFAQRLLQRASLTNALWSALSVMAMASVGLALLPSWGLTAMPLLPVLYAAWHWRYRQQSLWLQQPMLWGLALLWLLLNSLHLSSITPWYVLPILNPNDVLSLLLLLGVLHMIFGTFRAKQNGIWFVLRLSSLIMALVVLSVILIRALQVYAGLAFEPQVLWHSALLQLSLTLLWTFLALLLTRYASIKQHRAFWYVGAALLVLVVLKLILLDLAQSATLTRVISFMAAGALMLVIAYIAPLPPAINSDNNSDV